MLVPVQENSLTTDPFLKEFGFQLGAYADDFFREYENATRNFNEVIGKSSEDSKVKDYERRMFLRRRRRQVITPDLSSLQSGYSKYFGMKDRRKKPSQRRRDKGKPPEEDMPIVLVPQEDETECVASNQLSSFGFLGFILNVVNAVINVANNINNNNNSNNDNNNNNNNNDLNTNAASITQSTTNTNMAMAIAGRRLERLRSMRLELQGNLRALEKHRVERYRRSSGESRRNRRSSVGSSPEDSCSEGEDIVEEALLTSVALMDMWKDVLFEDNPSCMALELCETSRKLSQVSRLARMMVDVAGVAAAHMLENFQGVNPEYLTYAATQGLRGANCTDLYHQCH